MATNNPKVSGYVPQHVFDRFEQFYQERGLSMSQAVNEILAEYFGLEQSSAAPGGLLKERLERVERLSSSLGELLERVDKIEQQLGGSASRLPVVHSERTEHRNQSTSSSPSSSLEIKLSWEQIVKRLGISQSTIERKKNIFGDWSREKDPDGIGWRMVKEGHKLWFVPDLSGSNGEPRSGLLDWIDAAGLSKREREGEV